MPAGTVLLPGTEEWLEARKHGLGGTDISAVAGLNPWRTPHDVYLEKRGLVDPQPENEAMKMGKILEPVVLDLYEQRTGYQTEPGRFTVHPSYPWVRGTPDALTLAPDGPLVEIKTAGARQAAKWGEAGTDQIPDHYLLQVQWYLTLTKHQAADIAVLLGGQEFRLYHLAHNPVLEARLLEIGEAFWRDHILAGTPPEIGAGEGAKRWLQQAFPKDDRPELLESNERLDMMALQLAEARRRRDEAALKAEEIENRIKADIGAAAGIAGRNWRATWRAAKASASVNWEAVAGDIALKTGLPEHEYQKIVKFETKPKPGSRRFLFTFSEEE